jgi:hypothetical protein
LILVCYVVIGSVPVIIGGIMKIIVIDESGTMMGGSTNPVQFVLLMFSPIMLFVGVWLAQRIIHRRTLSDLLSTGAFRWPLVWQAMAIWLGTGIVWTLIEYLIYPERYVWSFNLGAWLTIAPLVLLLIPFQAAGEELFFRGYLMQAVARVWAQPLFLTLLSGVLFMVPHLANPEMSKALGGAIPMALSYFLVGVGTAWLSIKDNGVERAIGMHVVNNLYAGMFVGYANSALSTPTIVSSNVIDAWFGVIAVTVSFVVLIWWPLPKSARVVESSMMDLS